jgi:CRP/FNR family cyclic AMP-dependent transcriptional regulator
MVRTTELLRADPDLGRAVPPRLLARARRATVVATKRVACGSWDPAGAGVDSGGFGLLVLSGHLLRAVGHGGRHGGELLGPGDLLRPWQATGDGASLPFEPRWTAITGVDLAVLDADFVRRAAPFPGLAVQLVDRAMQRSRHLAAAIAIAHQPRVDDRLHRLLWSYADRWGTVGPDGVTLEVPLTHAILAELAAARRPTVSTALGRLAKAGLVERSGDAWRLCGEPPLDDLASES